MEIDKLYHLFFSFINHPQIEAKKRGRIKLYLGFNSLRNSKRFRFKFREDFRKFNGRIERNRYGLLRFVQELLVKFRLLLEENSLGKKDSFHQSTSTEYRRQRGEKGKGK